MWILSVHYNSHVYVLFVKIHEQFVRFDWMISKLMQINHDYWYVFLVLGLYYLNFTRYCYFDFIIILISPLKDKSEVDVERIKATLMLCYGYVALFSPVSLIVSRMEATILRSITPHFVNVKVSCTTQGILLLVKL